MFGTGIQSSTQTKFGLPPLDEILGGGLPRGSTFVIEQTIGADADPFIMSFLSAGLQRMDYTFLLTTEQTFDYYRRILQNFGRNPDIELSTGRLKYIDSFSGSFQTGLNFDTEFSDTQNILKVPDVTDPREVNEAIRRSLLHVQKGPNVGIRGAVMSLSNIIHMVSEQHKIFSFLQTRRAMDKLENSTSLISLNSDAHEPVFVRAIEHMVDGTMRVTRVENDEYDTPLMKVEIVNIKTKSELSGRSALFQYSSGRLYGVE